MNGLEIIPAHAGAMSVTQVKDQIQQIQKLMSDVMIDGEHFGASFPGDNKKNLLKPGADKLCFMFRLRPSFTQEIKEEENGHLRVFTRCDIYSIESDTKIAEGLGIATTLESKYRYRSAALACPVCGKETIIKGKKEYGDGYICHEKKGGCGNRLNDDDPVIKKQKTGKVENPDIADTYNTVIKVSKKRAYVDAVITATSASDIFTQDAEDQEKHQPKETGSPKSTGEKLAEDAANVSHEVEEITILINDGKLGGFTKAAIQAIGINDLNTIRGILARYKQGGIK